MFILTTEYQRSRCVAAAARSRAPAPLRRPSHVCTWLRVTALVALSLVACVPDGHAQEPPAHTLFTLLAPEPDPAPQAARERRPGRRVQIHADGLGARGNSRERLRMPLPDGGVVTFRRQRVEALPDDGLYWTGTAEDGRAGQVRLVRRRHVVVGHIDVDGHSWLLAPGTSGEHTIERGETGGIMCGGGRTGTPRPAAAEGLESGVASSVPQLALTGAPQVDVLIVFSPEAAAASGGDDGMRALADLSVSATNDALANSLVDARVRLVDVRVLPYVESGSMSIDLDRITAPADGHLDDVHALRQASGADIVSLVVEQNREGFEGLAWLMQQPSPSFQSLAFSVVLRRSAANLTLAHEIGHNLGLSHDRPNASSPGVYPFAYGYRDPPYFRDLMSYACTGIPCPRVAHFSNPDVTYAGRPTGRPDLEDGARALRITMPVAAQFVAGAGPVLTSVSPAQVPTLGGVRIILQGTRLSTVTRVRIGGVDATGTVALAPDTLSVVVPRRAQGVVDVVVEDDLGQSSSILAGLAFVPSAADGDGDALEDDWERTMGLDAGSAAGTNGADGDPDADGVANLQERLEHGHPLGWHRRYFAEGASGSFFGSQLALLNPGLTPAGAVVRYLSGDGTIRSDWLEVPARTRRTLTPADVAAPAGAEFSIVVESQMPLIVDRTMWWDASRYGAHAETSIAAPAVRWYLAEGATQGFALFYLLQNPGTSPARVRVRYLRAAGPPLEKTYALPPQSRTNIWVNREEFPGLGAALASAEVSAVIDVEDGPPIVVERAMYRDLPGQVFGAGHESAGIAQASTTWFLAEGATGPYFDLFVLMANPGADAASVEVSFLLPDGSTVEKAYVLPPTSRFTVWVDHEDGRLADTAVSTTVRSANGVPIIVERAMWWPGSSATWVEAHNSPGASTTAGRWALAEGEVGGARSVETYVLLANTSVAPVEARVTILFESGASVVRTFTVLGRSRFNVDVRAAFPEAGESRFATLVETVDGSTGLVVERAMYWNAGGQRWAAGTNALATPLH